MPKNMIQFQKSLSLTKFFQLYGGESQCRQQLFQWRWPKGFICPNCASTEHCCLQTRTLYQCNQCHKQTSLKSDTIFEATKLPLTVWFLAIYLMTQNKNGISILEMSRQLGISYNAAWRLKHKLMQVMKERDDSRPLSGVVQMDDAYWGGEKHGGKRGRGAKGKTAFVAAVQTNEKGHPIYMRFSKVKGFQKPELTRWAAHHLKAGTHVISDGLSCFNGVKEAACTHTAIVTGGGYESMSLEQFTWVNTMLGNVKNSLKGSYHAIAHKHVPRYLAEFSYRFNRRYDLSSMIARLGYIAARTPPMPERLLKMAEVRW